MNTSDRSGHPYRRRTDRIGHRGSGRGGRLISFSCRCSSVLRLGGSHRHDADDPMIVVTRYPDSGRIDARPDVRIYFEA